MREAIRMLAGKALLTIVAKRGTASDPQRNGTALTQLRWQLETTDVNIYLAKLFQLRNAVEPAAAEIAAVAARAEISIASAKAFDDMAENEAFVVADIAFHKGIYIATRNEFFWPIAQMFEITLRRSFTIAVDGDHRPRDPDRTSRGARCHRAPRSHGPSKDRSLPQQLRHRSGGASGRIDPFAATPPG